MNLVESFMVLKMLTLLPRSSAADIFDLNPNQNIARNRVVDKYKTIHTVRIDGYEFVVRTAATVAIPYKSYRDISVLHYEMPRDVSVAMFSFQVEDVVESANVGTCDPEDLIIHLKHGSYPAVNPGGHSFSKKFIKENNREKIHTLQLESSSGNTTYAVTNPKPGGWYAITYLKLKKSMKIEQKDYSQCDMESEMSTHKFSHFQYYSEFFIELTMTPSFFRCEKSLATECDAIFYTDLQVKRSNAVIVNCYSDITVHLDKPPVIIKCMIKDHLDEQTIKINIKTYPRDTREVIVKIQGLSIPSEEVIVKCYINLAMNHVQRISFQPFPNAWHYILIDKAVETINNITECNSRVVSEKYTQNELIDLTRENKGMSFNFEYNLPSKKLQNFFNAINITSTAATILRFNIQPTIDIGGTLTLAASLMLPTKNMKKRSTNSPLLKFTESDAFLKVVVCQDIAHHSIPLHNGSCSFNGVIKPALLLFNNKDFSTIKDSVMVPFPESGVWYLSIRLFCDGKDVENDQLRDAHINTSTTSSNSGHGVFECGGKIKFLVSSMPCVLGRCGDQGKCLFLTSGSSVLSSCYCDAGYGGWGCTDESNTSPLLSILLLTLSNLVFILSIFVAIRRKYYSEGIVYTFTMFFSTFYHACDAPVKVGLCIADIKILKFGDFYSGILSFWVTMLCMSVLKNDIRSAFQVIGAVVIACLVDWNMEDTLPLAVPFSCGILTIIVSWFVDHIKTSVLFHPPYYYKIYLPTGVGLVAVGLLCYTFWQTEHNYKYVHSLWHVLVALAVTCLLPNRRN